MTGRASDLQFSSIVLANISQKFTLCVFGPTYIQLTPKMSSKTNLENGIIIIIVVSSSSTISSSSVILALHSTHTSTSTVA